MTVYLLFCSCEETPRPKQLLHLTGGLAYSFRVYDGPGRKQTRAALEKSLRASHPDPQAAGSERTTKSGLDSSISTPLSPPPPAPSDTYPPTRGHSAKTTPPYPSQTVPLLVTKHSNISPCGDHSHSDHHSYGDSSVIKCLLYKPEVMDSDPQTPLKSQMWQFAPITQALAWGGK